MLFEPSRSELRGVRSARSVRRVAENEHIRRVDRVKGTPEHGHRYATQRHSSDI
jgi:hypothetical protein